MVKYALNSLFVTHSYIKSLLSLFSFIISAFSNDYTYFQIGCPHAAQKKQNVGYTADFSV